MKSVAAFLVVALIWFSGLLAFAARVRDQTPAPLPAPAQGIVALTGAGSSTRISEAVSLLEDGYGRRVLVSGVNPVATRDDIRDLSRAVRRLYDCCVDLGFTAADTVGNARETTAWAQAMRYDRLIVVTADFHMPRAMLELNAVLRGTGITAQAYPVATPALKARDWWRRPGAARLMVVEYCKYLAILVREGVLGLGPRAAPVAQQKSLQQEATS
ncbi:YdcF family protein [uncultured Phenylobacterium sp.]|uniref:YdcF family protein n=1 Tax=uncultured Phenylobacterium sp. TaxID=349273 RepID=UPI0025F20826|nr:YdcF family protein [uncultured Phenylobacterium sp.]